MEQEEIDAMHSQGLHFIGDWHTHPEGIPRTSPSDVGSIRRAFEQSKHHLNGFVLLIAGTKAFPPGLYLALYDSHREIPIVPD
jgi:proteasome lid subunit RPN8/RPN11